MAVTAVVAAVICLCEGLFFIFVRAPHPYGWEGFDHYRDYALVLARGDAFPTLDRIWGYPYFLAGFYRLFGDRPWIPLVAQAALNALVPILLYNEVKQRLGSRVAAVTAVLAGACSFNTIYASTQSSDAVCTVLFVAALVAFGRAQRSPAAWRFAASGALAALALEFRPNLLLFPLCLVAVDLVTTGRRRAMRHVAAFLLVAVAIWLPWPIRNYRLTGRFIPATTHGAVQLWYGSLEVGSFFENWVDNPRAAFEASPFDYSSPDAGPLVVTAAALPAAARLPQQVTLTYWTDRDPRHVELSAAGTSGPQTTFMVPGQPPDTIVSYYVEAVWPSAGGVLTTRTPVPGAGDPLRHVVTANHLGDLDFHNEDLDVFDLVRLLRHLAWREPVPNQAALDLDGDGVLTRADLDRAAGILASPAGFAGRPTPAVVADVRTTQDAVTLELTDDSSLTVPRVFGGRITDLDVDGRMAADIMRSRRSFASLAALRSTSADPGPPILICSWQRPSTPCFTAPSRIARTATPRSRSTTSGARRRRLSRRRSGAWSGCSSL